MATRALSEIRIGTRHRQDYGDIDALAQSIAEIGLLHPVVIRPDGRLIAGARRLRAFRQLKRETIPITVLDLEKVVLGEYAENAFRKAFTPSESVAIADAVEPIERARAKERQEAAGRERGRGKIGSGNFPTANKGRALDKVAMIIGKDRRTLEKAKAVVEAAESDPETFGKLQEDMDRTGRVNGVFRRLKVIKPATKIRAEQPALPGRGPYRVIVADPPWPYEVRREDPSQRGVTPYPQMSLEQIRMLPVATLAHDDCIL